MDFKKSLPRDAGTKLARRYAQLLTGRKYSATRGLFCVCEAWLMKKSRHLLPTVRPSPHVLCKVVCTFC